jgi:hypothetical protein
MVRMFITIVSAGTASDFNRLLNRNYLENLSGRMEKTDGKMPN